MKGLSEKLRHFKILRAVIKSLPAKVEIYLRNKVFGSCFKMKELKEGIIFIHVPKSAGSSISKALYDDSTYKHEHTPALNYSIENQNLFNELYSFAIVRNPWDRLHSAFEYLSKYTCFESFVLDLENSKLYESLMHFKRQYQYVCDKQGNVLVNLIGKVEKLDEFANTFELETGKTLNIGVSNASGKANYLNVYTEEMKLIVSRIYQRDIKNFNYDFEN